MELYLALLWLIVTGYCFWRLHVMVKNKLMPSQEITGVVYSLVLDVIGLVAWVLPVVPSRTVSIVVLVGCAVIASTISYKLSKKYEAWLEEQEEE